MHGNAWVRNDGRNAKAAKDGRKRSLSTDMERGGGRDSRLSETLPRGCCQAGVLISVSISHLDTNVAETGERGQLYRVVGYSRRQARAKCTANGLA